MSEFDGGFENFDTSAEHDIGTLIRLGGNAGVTFVLCFDLAKFELLGIGFRLVRK